MSAKIYIEIIAEAGLLGSKHVSTPIKPNHQHAKATDVLYPHPYWYCHLVGKLISLTITQPNLIYIVHNLAQFMQFPRQEHLEGLFGQSTFSKALPVKAFFFKLIPLMP